MQVDAGVVKEEEKEDDQGEEAADRCVDVTQSFAGTLVVVPPTLVQQWLHELRKHADVSVLVYDGMRACAGEKEGAASAAAMVRMPPLRGTATVVMCAPACRHAHEAARAEACRHRDWSGRRRGGQRGHRTRRRWRRSGWRRRGADSATRRLRRAQATCWARRQREGLQQ
jgi:hypothetical protein